MSEQPRAHAAVRVRYLIEAFALAAVAFAVDLTDRGDPGLLDAAVNPYLLAALAIAAWRGWLPGYAALAAGAALAFAGLAIFPAASDPLAHPRLPALAVTAVLGVLVFGLISFAWHRRVRRLQQEREAAERQRAGLLAAASELERQVSGQRDSLAYLHSRWRELSSADVDGTLRVLLDTVSELTGADRCSLWQLDAEAGELTVRATAGWDADDPAERRLPVNGSIEGWVVRNDRLFTAKHLTRYDTLRRADRGAVIYAAPLRAGARAWGVIDVERLPFERFNAHTEHLLLLTAAVAAAPLEQAIAYESDLGPAGRSAYTGYPLFTHLDRVLRAETAARAAGGGALSVILIRICNYHRLVSDASAVDASAVSGGAELGDRVIEAVFRAARQSAAGPARCFHYKEDGQLAVVCPGLDFDGAALTALDLLSWAAGPSAPDGAGGARPELAVGYSSLARGVDDADALLRMAENLLAMQHRDRSAAAGSMADGAAGADGAAAHGAGAE